jgi:catechol 2,3-dioxygenase-like lactoylglutathione lyase family enzyme
VIRVSGVNELVLEVEDLERSEAFWAGVLGFPVVDRWPQRDAIWVMAGEGTRIGLWRPQEGLFGSRGGEHVHFALKIEDDDYDATVATLRAGWDDVRETDFPGAGRSAYVNDPDGHLVEFWTWDVAGHLRPE